MPALFALGLSALVAAAASSTIPCKDCPAAAAPEAVQAGISNDGLVVNVGANARFNEGVAAPAGNWDLLYRWPFSPGTSFTTVRVDGADYVYGSSGTQIQPPTDVDPRTNESRWRVAGVEVAQKLSIVFNPQTGDEDTCRVEYTLQNLGSLTAQVGLRVMLDTELNYNDGAPFRVPGLGLVTSERELTGAGVVDSFHVFFSATDTSHVGAGILRGYGATPPDRVVFASWPRIAGTLYDYTVTPGLSITSDSAYALYFDPETLVPGATRTLVTYYGPARPSADTNPPLALTVNGPLALSVQDNAYVPNPFDVVATVRNIGTGDATAVALTLSLPTGLSLAEGTPTHTLGTLPPGVERQVTWRVLAAPQAQETVLAYEVEVVAANTDPKTVARDVRLPALAVDYCDQPPPSDTCSAFEQADLMSWEAMCQGRTAFSASDYQVLFDAVAMRTGVPRKVLKAVSFNEGLGTLYDDRAPRQFFEPARLWTYGANLPNAPQICSRYVGTSGRSTGPAPVTRAWWPLLGICLQPPCLADPVDRGGWLEGHPTSNVEVVHLTLGPDEGATDCELGGDDDCSYGFGVTQVTVQYNELGAPLVHRITRASDPDPYPSGVSRPPGPANYCSIATPALFPPLDPQNDQARYQARPRDVNNVGVSHVKGGSYDKSLAATCVSPNSAPCEQAFVQCVRACVASGGGCSCGDTNISPVDLVRLAKDPQYNILMLAQLILYKVQFIDLGTTVVPDVVDETYLWPYGRILRARATMTSPDAPRNECDWIYRGGETKTPTCCYARYAGSAADQARCSAAYVWRNIYAVCANPPCPNVQHDGWAYVFSNGAPSYSGCPAVPAESITACTGNPWSQGCQVR